MKKTEAKKISRCPFKMDDREYLRELVKSMPRRLKDVIRREGNIPGTSWRSSTPNGPFLGPKFYQKGDSLT
jgi:hypothetical protein